MFQVTTEMVLEAIKITNKKWKYFEKNKDNKGIKIGCGFCILQSKISKKIDRLNNWSMILRTYKTICKKVCPIYDNSGHICCQEHHNWHMLSDEEGKTMIAKKLLKRIKTFDVEKIVTKYNKFIKELK